VVGLAGNGGDRGGASRRLVVIECMVASTDEDLLIRQKERQITRLIRNFTGVFKEIDSGP
jgi:hypothetical protein